MFIYIKYAIMLIVLGRIKRTVKESFKDILFKEQVKMISRTQTCTLPCCFYKGRILCAQEVETGKLNEATWFMLYLEM